jgi:hypothetical protein
MLTQEFPHHSEPSVPEQTLRYLARFPTLLKRGMRGFPQLLECVDCDLLIGFCLEIIGGASESRFSIAKNSTVLTHIQVNDRCITDRI